MNSHSTLRIGLLATVSALFLVTACGRDEDRTVGQKVDSAIASAEQKTEEAKASTGAAATSMANKAENAAANMADKVENAAGKMADKVADAAITAGVNAELAKDAKLSALKIDVDTVDGRVALKGTAPDADSRDRATRLASAVKGVVSVDNRLTIGG